MEAMHILMPRSSSRLPGYLGSQWVSGTVSALVIVLPIEFADQSTRIDDRVCRDDPSCCIAPDGPIPV